METLKSQIFEVSKLNNLKYFNDISNESDRFERNFVRNKLLPEIHDRFPGYRGIFALRKKEYLGMLESENIIENKGIFFKSFSGLDISNLSIEKNQRHFELSRFIKNHYKKYVSDEARPTIARQVEKLSIMITSGKKGPCYSPARF